MQMSPSWFLSCRSIPLNLIHFTNFLQEAEQTAFIAQLTHEITMAQNTQENLRKQLKDRDDKVTLLESTLTDLDSKTTTLEQELNRVSTQELGLLQNSLREIAKLLLNDYEQHGTEGVDATHDLHLSSTPAIFIYDESGENPTVFAESIVSAVQAALNKRQLQIHSLQVTMITTISNIIMRDAVTYIIFRHIYTDS